MKTVRAFFGSMKNIDPVTAGLAAWILLLIFATIAWLADWSFWLVSVPAILSDVAVVVVALLVRSRNSKEFAKMWAFIALIQVLSHTGVSIVLTLANGIFRAY